MLFAYWVRSGETTIFFLILFFVVMSLLRQRVPKAKITIIIDFSVCAVLSLTGDIPGIIMALLLFESMYLGFYWSAFGVLYAFYKLPAQYAAIFTLGAACGYFISCWERERERNRLLRDKDAGRYYELENLQSDLVTALAQIEQMTAVHERARISRDIHDNAGHEIIAAYMSFQAVRHMMPPGDLEMTRLYDAALDRLDNGVNKVREAVYNLSTVTFLGVERLRNKCANFSLCKINFNAYGDTARIPIYIWSMLESCLSEALTNIARHSSATWVMVELDAALHIVRLCVTNNGVLQNGNPPGNGLRNLRHRAAAIGGSLSVDTGEVFSVICVVPIRAYGQEEKYEAADC